MSLFETDTRKHNAVLLVDASGSVRSIFDRNSQLTVFKKMLQVVEALPEDEFKVVFWNSEHSKELFVKGLLSFPYSIKKADLYCTFSYVENYINNYCATYPHLAFNFLNTDSGTTWIDNITPTKIYLITDGEMTAPGSEFEESIKTFTSKYNNIQLKILTVEPIVRNYNDLTNETSHTVAGCDVYNIIKQNNLTSHISEFTSYSLNYPNGYTHIENAIVPNGFAPFGAKYFSLLKMHEYMLFLQSEIDQCKSDDDVLAIVQKLSGTVSVLIKDKSPQIGEDIIRHLCSMFRKTSVDIMFINFILRRSLANKLAGSAELFSNYRAQLNQLYKTAEQLLHNNVKDAIGIRRFISMPVHNTIVSGPGDLVKDPVHLQKNTYEHAAVTINGILVPALPFVLAGELSPMNEQCLRQWIRAIVAHQYSTNPMSILIIYLVLGINIIVQASDLPPDVKDTFKYFGTVMLKKKNYSCNVTELERLEQGYLPMTNTNDIKDIFKHLEQTATLLNFGKTAPFALWYKMCEALGNEKILTYQLAHCVDSIKDVNKVVSPAVYSYSHISDDRGFDYQCIITLDDISNTGGYRFNPHISPSGALCQHKHMLSYDGYANFISQHNVLCPICYANLTHADFEKVGPRPPVVDITCTEFSGKPNIFRSAAMPQAMSFSHKENNMARYLAGRTPRFTGHIIILRGTVGSGKTTLAQRIKEEVEHRGGVCEILGMDMYASRGVHRDSVLADMSARVSDMENAHGTKVVVIDTCGDCGSISDTFGMNFSAWCVHKALPNFDANNREGYFAWSLRNVLRRGDVTPNCNYFLTPTRAGVDTCIQVHKKKSKLVVGKKLANFYSKKYGAGDFAAILDRLAQPADAYQSGLVDPADHVNKILSRISFD